MNEGDLRLPRLVYRLRTLGLGVGFFAVAEVFRTNTASPFWWTVLVVNAFAWPQVAWYLARTSDSPHRAERWNLLADSAMGGVWVALMRFNLLPSVLIVAMLSMDKIGWGWRFLAKTTLVMIAAGAGTFLLAGAPARLATTMPEIVAALPLLVAYPLAIAVAANRSGRLARDRRKAMEQVLVLREQLAHAARVGTLGEMAAGLAHELNQPLTAIHVEANVALELATLDDRDGVRESLSRISDQSLRGGEIVRRMRTFARRGEVSRERLDLAEVISEVLALLAHDLTLAGVETTVAPGDRVPPILADRVEIQQVLVNLVRNAIEAMARPDAQDRRLTIRTQRVGQVVRVSVADTGGGVDPAVLDRLFHPFQSTKATGLGLGLSICQSLIEAHGGRVGAGPHPAGGASFYFELPSAEEKSQA